MQQSTGFKFVPSDTSNNKYENKFPYILFSLRINIV